MLILLFLRINMEVMTPTAITELTLHYFLELEWNFLTRRRLTAFIGA